MSGRSRVRALREAGPAGAARLAFRKAVYRKVTMGRYGARAGDHVPPARPLGFRLEVVGPERFGEVAGTNPHLSQVDLERFRSTWSRCILVWDGERLASSSWMARGEVWVDELQRTLSVPAGEHFSCRSFVDPEYRGASLFSHMIYGYARSVPEQDLIWGLVYARNVASIASLARVGWQLDGEYWTRWIADRPYGGERRFPARPARPSDQP